MRRFTVVLVLGMILAFALAAPALAAGEEVAAAYEPGVPFLHGVPSEGRSFAQCFTAEKTGVLAFADLNLGRPYDHPQAYVDLYRVTGANDTESVPTGDPIAQSQPITSHDAGFARFTFAGTAAFLTAGEQYALVLRTEADVMWHCSVGAGDAPCPGNMAYLPSTGWTVVPEWVGADFYFRVWVNGPAAAYEPGVASLHGIPSESRSLAQTFTAEKTGVLAFADLSLGHLYDHYPVYVDLYRVTGANDTESVPTGDPIAQSQPITAHDAGFAHFTFAGTDAFLTAGEQYALVLRTEADVMWHCSVGAGDAPCPGNMAYLSDAGWTVVPEWVGADFYFRVWVGNPAAESVNHAPAIAEAGISAGSSLVPVGTPVHMTAAFSDEDAGDSHTATWQWTRDDASVTSPGAVSGTTVTGSHTYAVPGVYEVTLRVADAAGAEAVQSFRYVVVYDPAAGFVTGGGWIDSPAGALVSDPTLTGKASFGFVSKYQKGATVPSGSTQFQFQAGSLCFRSTSYDWLVIAGARAQYKGSGTINGQGDYGFMLTAVDGQVNGGGGADKFRIKIWDKAAGGAIVYDNQMHAADDATPATALGGGSIVIHK